MEDLVKTFQVALKECLKNAQHGDKTTLAHTAGVHISTLYNLESGRRGTSETNRRKIAAALGYSYEEFLELGRNVIHGIKIDPKTRLVSMPSVEKEVISEQASEIINQILFIAENDIQKLTYISPVVKIIHDEIRAVQDKSDEKQFA